MPNIQDARILHLLEKRGPRKCQGPGTTAYCKKVAEKAPDRDQFRTGKTSGILANLSNPHDMIVRTHEVALARAYAPLSHAVRSGIFVADPCTSLRHNVTSQGIDAT
jgi:hypothetical protein